MARRSDHTREELKDMIATAAWTIVGAEGWEGLTARRVAAAIGYVPGTIYNIYGSMDDLYVDVNGRTLDMLYDVLAGTAAHAGGDPAANMKAMATLYMAFAQEHRPHWLMLFSHQMPDGKKPDDAFQQKMERIFEPLELLMTPLFKAAQQDRRKMAARLLWSSVHGLCFLRETGKIHLVGDDTPAAMADYLIDTFVAGLRQGTAAARR